jgi:hypothetical protein
VSDTPRTDEVRAFYADGHNQGAQDAATLWELAEELERELASARKVEGGLRALLHDVDRMQDRIRDAVGCPPQADCDCPGNVSYCSVVRCPRRLCKKTDLSTAEPCIFVDLSTESACEHCGTARSDSTRPLCWDGVAHRWPKTPPAEDTSNG